MGGSHGHSIESLKEVKVYICSYRSPGKTFNVDIKYIWDW